VLICDLSPGRRLLLRVLTVVALLALGVLVLHDVLGVGGARLDAPITNWVQNNVFLLAAALCLLRVA
jgi:hypothetical protein